MADWGQNDEVVSKPSTPVAKSSWGQEDEVVKQPSKQPTKEVGGRWHNIARTAVEAAPAAAAGLAGFGAGMEAAAPVAAGAATISGPFAPITAGAIELAGGLGGAFIASGAAQKVTDWMHEAFAPEDYKQRQIEKAQHPYGTFAAQTATNLAGMSPKTAPEVAGKLLSKPIAQRAVSAGLQTGIEAGTEYAQEGKVDPAKLAMSAAAGAAMPGFNVLGEKVFKAGQAVIPTKKAPAATPETPKTADVTTPEEQAALVRKLEEINKAKTKDQPTPRLVETALKNKETGDIERMGPKHDENRKAETADTHDQGFVDEQGNFLDRKQAWERAKETGQIPKEQNPEYPSEGLHSGDLRIAKDEAFKIADVPSEVNGIPIKQESTGKTRPDGRPVGATTRRNEDGSPKEIVVDTGVLYQQFKDKPWTEPKVEGVEPLPEDAFKTPQEWIDFVVQHEIEHTRVPRKEGQSKGEYEDQTNKAALHTLASRKAAKEVFEPTKPTEPTPTEPVAAKDPLAPTPIEVDRTKTDPRDVKSEEEMYEIAAEIYAKSGVDDAVKFYEGYKEYKKTWLEPVAETEKFVGTNIKNKLAAERVISNNTHDLTTMGKDGNVNLEELTYKIDGGKVLTGEEKSIAAKFRGLMDELGKRAMEMGVIKGWHENYVARNVVTEGAAPPTALQEFMQEVFGSNADTSMGGTKTTTKYGKERKLKTREDLNDHINRMNQWLEENGKDYRFKLKSDNLAEIYKDYAQAVEKAIENKKLIDNLKQVRNAEGESLIRPITPENPLPHGWEVMEGSELAGYAVHPDLKPALKFVFDAGPGELMSALGNISQFTKRLNVIGSFFHAKSLMEVMSSAQIPIWTPVKEAIVLPLAEKAIKATTGKDIQLSAISKAVEQFRKGGVGDNVDKWIKSELAFDMPEDVSKGILSATGKFADSMIGKYGPKTRILEKSLSTVEKYTLGLFDKYTWDYLHTGGKLMVADAYLDKARLQAAKEGKPFNEDAARIEIARFVNDSFGGLNWFDAATSARTELGKRISMAAYSPEGRRSLQIALFAPDWTISTLRAFSSALPKELNPTKWHPVEGVKGMMTPTTKADYARLYQFKTALTYLTLINAINLMTADRPVWENKDPTRIEWPDGTSMQAMKHAMEPYHWIADPDKTLANKLGFIPKAVIVGVAGTEYASPNAPKLVDRGAASRLKAVVGMAEPFQVQAYQTAPQGEGAKRAALGTLGFPVYGSTPAQRKLANAERELATKEKAWEYRDKEIKAGRIPYTTKHSQEGETLRRRRKEMNRKTGKE